MDKHEKYRPLFERLEAQGATMIILPPDPNGHFTELKEAINERYNNKTEK